MSSFRPIGGVEGMETPAEAAYVYGKILDGKYDAEQIEDFLEFRARAGETVPEIVGAAIALRERMHKIEAPKDAIDVCGTGGDNSHSLNVSTAVAIVVAACGVPVAKHGNRASSSLSGAADTLEALGLNLDRASERATDSLDEFNLAFLFAQRHHPSLAKIAPIRNKLGFRTVFNLVGPLCNPASVTRQLLGVAMPKYVPLMRDALMKLGTEKAMVVSGSEGLSDPYQTPEDIGLDELSTFGRSIIESIGLIDFHQNQILPKDAGLQQRYPILALRGGTPQENADGLRALLQCRPSDWPQIAVRKSLDAYRNAVLLNAAAALVVAGDAKDLTCGVEIAAHAIDSGEAFSLLQCWIKFCE